MRVGIIGAMEIEVAQLRGELSGRRDRQVAGMLFSEGSIAGVECAVVKCGAGKVNAALCVQVLVSCLGATHVVNTGVAGSLAAAIDILDVVVSTDCVYHDVDATNFGYRLGEVPQMGTLSFAADEGLREAAVKAAQKTAPGTAVHQGRVASGDQFVCRVEDKQRIAGEFGALCCEMEGAAIAHACWRNDVPFVVMRAISDKADGSDRMSYDEFEVKAANRCAGIMRAMLAEL